MYKLKDVRDDALLGRLAELNALGNRTTAEVLAHIAEVDDRHLYLKMGYVAMAAYCVGELHMSEAAARRRVHAAHTARAFPALFDAIAEGRLHLTAIALLSARFTTTNVDELIAAATHKSVGEIERLLVERWPQAEELHFDGGVRPQVVVPQQSDADSRFLKSTSPGSTPGSAPPSHVKPRVEPLTPQRFAVQVSIASSTYEKLCRAQDLLSHVLPSRDVANVFDRALDALLEKLEKRKVGAGTRRSRKPSSLRAIPTRVKRAVWERDGGRCSLVGAGGRRCRSTDQVEFDHIKPVALGGGSTVDNVRLLCRAHNQYAAEEALGRKFMDERRRRRRLPPVSTLHQFEVGTGFVEPATRSQDNRPGGGGHGPYLDRVLDDDVTRRAGENLEHPQGHVSEEAFPERIRDRRSARAWELDGRGDQGTSRGVGHRRTERGLGNGREGRGVGAMGDLERWELGAPQLEAKCVMRRCSSMNRHSKRLVEQALDGHLVVTRRDVGKREHSHGIRSREAQRIAQADSTVA